MAGKVQAGAVGSVAEAVGRGEGRVAATSSIHHGNANRKDRERFGVSTHGTPTPTYPDAGDAA